MDIFLSRHGNTFEANQQVVWTGTSNDLPLVAHGHTQAKLFAAYLLAKHIRPVAIYCSELQRTSAYAQILQNELQIAQPPVIDHRLNEIDYGLWTGLTNEQVKQRFGEAALLGWTQHAKWPQKSNWGQSAQQIIQEVHDFFVELTLRHAEHDTVIVISSHGRLRYFLTLIADEFEKRIANRTFQVSTGHICQLRHQRGKTSLLSWNTRPG